MKNIIFSAPIADAGNTFYIPVPCRGTVKSSKVSCDVNMVATGTVILSRSTTAVNTITVPTGDKAAGTTLAGVPDATNKSLVFDPDSTTVANNVIKVVVDGTILASAGNMVFTIEYDDSAYVAQTSMEA
jgi:hypothetical protein